MHVSLTQTLQINPKAASICRAYIELRWRHRELDFATTSSWRVPQMILSDSERNGDAFPTTT